MGELLSAIKKMKSKGAVGPDNIPPSFLKSLGPLALQESLSIFNSSFSLAHCPIIWRIAIIIQLLKAGKSPSEVASFRPISLTSCVVKLLERIFADCLYYIAKTKFFFSRFRAWFCKGQSCKDQIARIVQAIEEGFQQQRLLLNMLDAGIASTSIRLLYSFLNDRRAGFQLFNVFSSSRRFNQGLPQSSVLPPLLFLFYLNNLASSLTDDAVVALFADDVSILTTAHKREDAEAAAQSVANSVFDRSQQWKLNLSADKSEVCPFSTWSNDNTWQPVRVNHTSCLLGAILDRSLTFNAYMKKLTASLTLILRIL